MALQKSYELANGTSGNYWRIIGLHISMLDDTASIVCSLYKDHDARTGGKAGMYEKCFTVSLSVVLDKEAESVDNPLKLAYDALKELDMFSGAEDA